MQADFLVLGADEVVDNVGARGGPARVAEPLVADETLDYARGIEDAAIGTSVLGKILEQGGVGFIADAVEKREAIL